VLLDDHVIALANGLDALGRPLHLRFIAASRDHGDPVTVELDATPGATALRPLAPVHVRATRVAGGVRIRWVRRTRRDGDSWAAGEVPLAEEREAYEVDVLSGSSVVRVLQAGAPEVLYTAASEAADFGGAQASLSVRVFQLSATVGRGYPAAALLNHLA
jgi:hypothetical protein